MITESSIKQDLLELLPDTVNLSNILHTIRENINDAPKRQNDFSNIAIEILDFSLLLLIIFAYFLVSVLFCIALFKVIAITRVIDMAFSCSKVPIT